MSPGNPRTELLRFLGLAHRAGSVVVGTDAVRRAVREGRARVVLLAEDASDTQLKKIKALLEHRGLPSAVLGTREELGAALGRGRLSAAALTLPAFAEGFLAKLRADVGAAMRPGTEQEDETHAG
ncbi:MAG: ribosomal L7Ae/L30e/S12e/Gadd45 family protein [Longimicrobiales bacterium]|nr:ribosomal L7Ae/L30e/S12e/Gadd45 family protein [Longimicrobiales bacterium]